MIGGYGPRNMEESKSGKRHSRLVQVESVCKVGSVYTSVILKNSIHFLFSQVFCEFESNREVVLHSNAPNFKTRGS